MRCKSLFSLTGLGALYLAPTLITVSAGTLQQCMSSLTLSPNSYIERDDGYVVDMHIGGGAPCVAGMNLDLTVPSLPGASCQSMYFYADGPFPASQTFYCYPPYDYQAGGFVTRFLKNSAFNLAGTLSDGTSSKPITKNFPLTVRKSALQLRLEACAASLKLGAVTNSNDGFDFRFTHGTNPSCADFNIQPTDPTGVVQCRQQTLYEDPTQEYETSCYYSPVRDKYSVSLNINVVYSKDLTINKGSQKFSPTGATPAINAIRCAQGLVYEAEGPIGDDGVAHITLTTIPEECRATTDSNYLQISLYYGSYSSQYCTTHAFVEGGDLIIDCDGRNEDSSSAPFDTDGVSLPIRGSIYPAYNYYGADAPVANRTLTWTPSAVNVCQDSFKIENFALASTSATTFDLTITKLSATCQAYQSHIPSTTIDAPYCTYVDFDSGSSSYTTSCQYTGGSASITLTPALYNGPDYPFDESFTVNAPSNGANCASTITIDQYYNPLRYAGEYPQANDLTTVYLDFDSSECNGVSVSLFDAGGLHCPEVVFQAGSGYVTLLCNVNGQAPGAYTTHPRLDGVEHSEVDLAFNTHLDPVACGQSVTFTSIAAADYTYTFYAVDTSPFTVKIDYRGDYCDSSFAFSPILQDFTAPDQATVKRTVTYDCGSLAGNAAGSAQYTCGTVQGAMPTGDWGAQVTPCPSDMDVGDCYYASTGFSVINSDTAASPPAAKRKREEDQVIITGTKTSSRRCNTGFAPCPLPGRALLWECVDIMRSMDTCGGCWNTREGIDCSELAGVEDIACIAGVCIASTCTDDYVLSTNQTCVPV